MITGNVTRNVALLVGALAIAGMGFTAGCSAKQTPAPTEQTDTHVDSKRPKSESGEKPNKESFAPEVTAPAAPTKKPGD